MIKAWQPYCINYSIIIALIMALMIHGLQPNMVLSEILQFLTFSHPNMSNSQTQECQRGEVVVDWFVLFGLGFLP